MTLPQTAVASRAPNQNRKTRRLARKKVRGGLHSQPQARQRGQTPKSRAAIERAQALMRAKDYAGASQLLRAAVAEFPEDADCWLFLGVSLEYQGSKDAAYQCYKRSLDLAPENAEGWVYLARMLCERNQPKACELAVQRCLTIDPDHVEALKILALARLKLGDSQGGLPACRAALAQHPHWNNGFYIKGLLHKADGDLEAAREALLHANKLDPRMIDTLHALADMSQGPQLDELLQKIDAIAPDSIADPRERSDLFFVAARVQRALERDDDAFALYRKANGLLSELFPFDRDAHREKIDELIEAFSPELFAEARAGGSDSNRPVFIVGMPRSGTTLTEQIIASHSQACGAGEHSALIEISEALNKAQDCEMSYPRDVAGIAPEALGALAQQYLSNIEQDCPADASRFTDKMVFNYLNLGLIALLFPNASIIHCRRSPMDTCLSCYFVRFGNASSISFAADQEALGFYYRQYHRLMDHWRSVLPLPILDVDYEKLVTDQEAESRRIVAFLGLDWEDGCLRFHEQGRAVTTASAVQVRKPVYQTSAGRWRRYEKHLAPLQKALGDLA